MTERTLAQEAIAAMNHAYAPYSGFFVGAALLAADGKVYTGCNVENASFTPTVCAERTAVFKAVSEGVRDFKMLAIVGGKGGRINGICPPCGVCRQVLSEFCPPDFPILLVEAPDRFRKVTLADLLPYAFSAEDTL
ncbi:MAG: cytidine deaminase [Ruminococcaceae bacterium]|nr:cytidine deaminase [Oscillospiraceae bacterium]